MLCACWRPLAHRYTPSSTTSTVTLATNGMIGARRALSSSAATFDATVHARRAKSAPPRTVPQRMLRPASSDLPEFRRVPGIGNPEAQIGKRRVSDVTEWTKSPLVALGMTNDPQAIAPTSKVFRHLPINQGFIEQLTQMLHGRNALRLDVHRAAMPPLNPTPIQRLSFQHFFTERDTQTLTAQSIKAKALQGAEGWLFPKAPGSSTLLASETGGGKTIAYLLPLLQRLKETQHENFQREFGLKEASERADARASHFASEATKELDAFDPPESEEPEWTDDPDSMLMSERQPTQERDQWLTGEELSEFESFVREVEKSQGPQSSRQEALGKMRRTEVHDVMDNWEPPSKPEQPFLVRPRSIILVPTHELARQVETNIKALTHIDKLRTVCTSRNEWRRTLHNDIGLMTSGLWDRVRPIDVLVTTPERLLDITTTLSDRNARYKALHRKYVAGEDYGAAHMLERHVERDYRRQLVSLDAVRAVVCDEADVLWDTDHFVATKHLMRSVVDKRMERFKTQQKPQPLVPADVIHVTASVSAGFKHQLGLRFPQTKYILSKGLHQLSPNLRVKFANDGPTRQFAFAREVRDALLSDPTDKSRVLVFCDRRQTVRLMSMVLDRVGILNTTLTSETKDRSRTSNNHLAGFLLDPRKVLNHSPKSAPEVETAGVEEARAAPDVTTRSAPYDLIEQGQQEDVIPVRTESKNDKVDGPLPTIEAETQSSTQVAPFGAARMMQTAVLDAVDMDEIGKQLELEEAEREGIPRSRVMRAYRRSDERKQRHDEKEPLRAARREQRRLLGSALPKPIALGEAVSSTPHGQKLKDVKNFKKELVRKDKNKEKGAEEINPYAPLRAGNSSPDPKNVPRVLITTSMCSRGLDFTPLVTHVIIPDTSAATRAESDTPDRNAMSTMELLHRAGRVGRAGVPATLVLFDNIATKSSRPQLRRNGRFRGFKLGRLESAVRSLRPLTAGRDGPTTKNRKRDIKYSRGAERIKQKEKDTGVLGGL